MAALYELRKTRILNVRIMTKFYLAIYLEKFGVCMMTLAGETFITISCTDSEKGFLQDTMNFAEWFQQRILSHYSFRIFLL